MDLDIREMVHGDGAERAFGGARSAPRTGGRGDYRRRLSGDIHRYGVVRADFSALKYSTYIGGVSQDTITSLQVLENLSVYMAGITSSIDITTASPIIGALQGTQDVLLMRTTPLADRDEDSLLDFYETRVWLDTSDSDYDDDGIATNDPYPWCPTYAGESDEEYMDRRVQMIKQIAYDAGLGLRREVFCDQNSCIVNNYATPGMFGVSVWGFPSFEEADQEDHPGIPGLPVRVQVVYNVPLVVFAPLLPNPYIRVSGATEMINEGVQVGYGNLAPSSY